MLSKYSLLLLVSPIIQTPAVNMIVLLVDGDHPAAFPEDHLEWGEGILFSAAGRCGQKVDQSHGEFGSQSHATPLHCHDCP